MKREEKSEISRRKIIESAVEEFGEKGYGLSSINVICKTGDISKGILYHHFADKDELYIAAVSECFEKLTDYLQEKMIIDDKDIEMSLKRYFDIRLDFFEENPLYQRLFCSAVISPPEHLISEIANAKSRFDMYNKDCLVKMLKSAELSPEISVDEVSEIFGAFQDFANAHMQMKTSSDKKQNEDINDKSIDIKATETIRKHLLHVLLYGVIKRENSKNE